MTMIVLAQMSSSHRSSPQTLLSEPSIDLNDYPLVLNEFILFTNKLISVKDHFRPLLEVSTESRDQ